MAMVRITDNLAIDWDRVYAITGKRWKNDSFPGEHLMPGEISIFCDIPNATPGKPFITIIDQSDIGEIWGRVEKETARFERVESIAYDKSKVYSVASGGLNSPDGSISFRFSDTRSETISLDGRLAQLILTQIPWPSIKSNQ